MMEIWLWRPGISIDGFNEGFNQETIALRPLAKSWKSCSEGKAPKIHNFSKGFKKEMIAMRALAKSWKFGCVGQAALTHGFC